MSKRPASSSGGTPHRQRALEQCPLGSPIHYQHPDFYYAVGRDHNYPCEFVYNCHYQQGLRDMMTTYFRTQGHLPREISQRILSEATQDPLCVLALDIILNLSDVHNLQYVDIERMASDIIRILVENLKYPLSRSLNDVISNPQLLLDVATKINSALFHRSPTSERNVETIETLLRDYFRIMALKAGRPQAESIRNLAPRQTGFGFATYPRPIQTTFIHGGERPSVPRPSGRVNPIAVNYQGGLYVTPQNQYVEETPEREPILDEFLEIPVGYLDSACIPGTSFSAVCQNPNALELYMRKHNYNKDANGFKHGSEYILPDVIERYLLKKTPISAENLRERIHSAPNKNKRLFYIQLFHEMYPTEGLGSPTYAQFQGVPQPRPRVYGGPPPPMPTFSSTWTPTPSAPAPSFGFAFTPVPSVPPPFAFKAAAAPAAAPSFGAPPGVIPAPPFHPSSASLFGSHS